MADEATSVAGNSTSHSHHFSDQGYKSAYWVRQKFDYEKFANLLAMRQGHGKVYI